jgi:uroporphyrin-3 C-methyltransferase
MEHRIMTDKEVSEKKLSEKNNTEIKEAATSSSGANTKTDSAAIAAKKTPSSASKKPLKSDKKITPKTEKKSNKTATIAIALAAVSIFSSIGHYVWQQQKNSAQLFSIKQENQQAIQQSQEQLKNTLTTEFTRQLQQQLQARNKSQQSAQKAHLDSDTQITLLMAQVSQLEQQVSQRDPSDWLVHEAEYLIRIAARTMWLERDTQAAISLLRDADNRLKELDQPKFLPVRALINEDIETLALMPRLNNQEAVLTLMALNKQIPTLLLSGVNLTEALDGPKEDFVLSDDVNDWQENLAKTWQKFLNDFITVRRREGMVEPLMTPDQQQHLKQNLSLKIQLVQWAASEQKAEIYQQTLLDIQQWLNEFFDMDLTVNKKFYQTIEQLKKQTIYYDYPSELRSATAIKRLLDNTKQGFKPQVREVNNKDEAEKSATEKPIASSTEQSLATENTIPAENKPTSGGQL